LLPLSLTVRNFLSYRENAPTLRLEGIHVACLCGANGHGKSALLDAMTWALWGKARGQRAEQLIHQGQQEMSVTLDFEAAGQRYRVTRRYSHARRTPQSSLEIGVETGEGYRPITADTIPATQAHIERLVGMDYATFVNSAFLLQGRADLFTMATPAERKQVLASVLGLGLYDRLEEIAKQRAKGAQAQVAAIGSVIDRLHEQASRMASVETELADADRQIEASRLTVESLAERLELVRARVADLERRQAETDALAENERRAAARERDARQEALQMEQRIAGWNHAMARAEETEAGAKALASARARLDALRTAEQRYNALHRELAPLEQRIAADRARLEAEVAALQRHLNRDVLPKAAGLQRAEQQIAERQAALASVGARAAAVSALVERHQALAVEARRLLDDNVRVKALGEETRAKLDLLDHQHADGAACPLCEQSLDATALARLRTRYHDEIAELRRRYRDQDASAKQLSREAEQAQAEAAREQQAADTERRRLESEIALLAAQREEAQRAAAEAASLQAALAESRLRLDAKSYAEQEHAAAATLRARIAELAFDPQEVLLADDEVKRLAPWEVAERTLTEAKTRLTEDGAALERVRARQLEAAQELAQVVELRKRIADELRELPAYETRRAGLERERDAARVQYDGLQSRRGSLRTQLDAARHAQVEWKARQADQQEQARRAAIYDELAVAFGKGGVQALLIETAIPRLEADGNELLKRMTDGRMSLKMETQRAKRTGRAGDVGEPVETLEINISDELGHRAYEMFSGGERFRIDFALRIALSKLLAWRSGAALPTLFIDEGFGTQDADGRDHIVELIRTIEDQFQRILVITHMGDVKEAFPVRIEVTRTLDGSTFAIS